MIRSLSVLSLALCPLFIAAALFPPATPAATGSSSMSTSSVRTPGPESGLPLPVRAMMLAAAAQSGAAPLDAPRLSYFELGVWNTQAFQRRFAESYLAASEVEPTLSRKEREVMVEIAGYISAEDFDKATELLEKELRSAAASAVFDFTLGNIHFQGERLDEAAAAYENAINKFGRFRRAHKNLGLIRVRQRSFADAIDPLTEVIELGGGDSDIYGLLGYAYANIGAHLAAESGYRMAMLLDPATDDWKMGLARSLFQQQRFGEAAALIGGLLSETPDRADLWLLQANAFIGMNEPLRAAENYEIVDGLGGSTADSLNLLGDIYVNEGLFQSAVAAYLRALDLDPALGVDRAVRAAKIMAARNALDETAALVIGLDEARRAELSDGQRKELLRIRARVAAGRGDAGDAEAAILREIIELDPLDGDALIKLGRYHFDRAARISNDDIRNETYQRAVFYFQRAESLPDFEADAKVGHGKVLIKLDRRQDALRLFRAANELKPREDLRAFIEQLERRVRR